MKKFVAIMTLVLTACSSERDIMTDAGKQCRDIGINTTHPDFRQKHSSSEIDGFYNCIEAQLQPTTETPVFGSPGSTGRSILESMNHGNKLRDAAMVKMEYQRGLWHQVISHKEKPDKAEQDWIKFVIALQNNQAALASQAATADSAAARARRQQQDMDDQLQEQTFQMQQQNMALQQMQQQQLMQNSMQNTR